MYDTTDRCSTGGFRFVIRAGNVFGLTQSSFVSQNNDEMSPLDVIFIFAEMLES